MARQIFALPSTKRRENEAPLRRARASSRLLPMRHGQHRDRVGLLCELPRPSRGTLIMKLKKIEVLSWVVRDAGDAPIVSCASEAAKELESIKAADREHFVVLCLSARRRVIARETVSIGTLSASLVHPREVFKPAIMANAAAIIIAHNHPSGDFSPSAEDREVTKRIQRAGEILGIPLADHVIVSTAGYFSFREGGIL